MTEKRIGTCHFCLQLERIVTPADHPHQRQHVEIWPEEFRCFFISAIGDSPPPVERESVFGHQVHEGDCESCAFYMPAGEYELTAFLRKRKAKHRRRLRTKAKRATA